MGGTRLVCLITAVAAASLVIGACGGDDSSSDEDAEITDAITQAATLDTVEACTEFQTQAFTEQTEFATGEEAVTLCEASAGDGGKAGESVEVDNIEADGESATADVSFTGGAFDAQQLAVSLVKEEDHWKLDSLDGFIDFDKAAFTEALIASAEEDESTTEEVVACLRTTLEATADEQVQMAVLSGDEDEVSVIFGTCFGDA